MTGQPYTDADFEAAWNACAAVRDAAPRLPNDASTSEVVAAVLDAVAPAIAARAAAEALRDLSDRMGRAYAELDGLRDTYWEPCERQRIAGKAQGVALARSYAQEHLREIERP